MIELAKKVADKYAVDPALFCALIRHESSWDPRATRYEPAFYDRYISHMAMLTVDEKRLRATSLGLCQVMGQVAREQGYTGQLEGLFDPETNMEHGAKKLARCLKRATGDVREALLLYNGGGAEEYPDLVLQFIEEYR